MKKSEEKLWAKKRKTSSLSIDFEHAIMGMNFLAHFQGHLLALLGLSDIMMFNLKRSHLLLKIRRVAKEVDGIADPYLLCKVQHRDTDMIEIVRYFANVNLRHDGLFSDQNH
jgi:hypothetical protein